MRPTPGEASYNLTLLHPPSPSTNYSSCEHHHGCPYSAASNNHIQANATVVLIVLLCGLISALSLNAAIRCFLRTSSSSDVQQIDHHQQGKPAAEGGLRPPDTVVYSIGMEGAVEECAICLTEFVEGEGVKVLGRCKHGFHEQCIQHWLSSSYSCPTCRTSCLLH